MRDIEIQLSYSLRDIVLFSLDNLELEQSDLAARELALIIAEQIDIARDKQQARNIAELSSKLTTLMVELNMTPKARKAIKTLIKEEGSNEHADAARILEELQAAAPK
jgi:hypothetical protein